MAKEDCISEAALRAANRILTGGPLDWSLEEVRRKFVEDAALVASELQLIAYE